jgi:hypothetical protein
MRSQHDSCLLNDHSVLGNNHLMVNVKNIHAFFSKLLNKALDAYFAWIPLHVTPLFILISTQDFVDGTRQLICNGNLGFIGRAQFKQKFVVLGPIKAASL